MEAVVRRFIRDAIEGSITAILALALTMPSSVDDAKRMAAMVAVAVIGATIACSRRELLPYLLDRISPKP